VHMGFLNFCFLQEEGLWLPHILGEVFRTSRLEEAGLWVQILSPSQTDCDFDLSLFLSEPQFPLLSYIDTNHWAHQCLACLTSGLCFTLSDCLVSWG
jgi:hypothetical protein